MILLLIALIAGVSGLELVTNFTLPAGVEPPLLMDANNVYSLDNGTLVAYNFSGVKQANFTPIGDSYDFIPDRYYWYTDHVNADYTEDVWLRIVEKNGSLSTINATEVFNSTMAYHWIGISQSVGVFTEDDDLNFYVTFYSGDGNRTWEKECPINLLGEDGNYYSYGKGNVINYHQNSTLRTVEVSTCIDGIVYNYSDHIVLDNTPIDALHFAAYSGNDGWAVYEDEDYYYIFEYLAFKKKGDEISLEKGENGFFFFADGWDLVVVDSSTERISFSNLNPDGTLSLIWEKEGNVTDDGSLFYNDTFIVTVDDVNYLFKYDIFPIPTPVPTPTPAPSPTPTPTPTPTPSPPPESDEFDSMKIIITGSIVFGLSTLGAAAFYFFGRG